MVIRYLGHSGKRLNQVARLQRACGKGNGRPTRDPAADREVDEAKIEVVEDPEYFLTSLLASDPLPYLVDSAGNPVDVEGRPSSGIGSANGAKTAEQVLRERLAALEADD